MVKLTVDDIDFEVNDFGIKSNIAEKRYGCARPHPYYSGQEGALLAFLYAFVEAGGDPKTPAVYAGIRAVLDRLNGD